MVENEKLLWLPLPEFPKKGPKRAPYTRKPALFKTRLGAIEGILEFDPKKELPYWGTIRTGFSLAETKKITNARVTHWCPVPRHPGLNPKDWGDTKKTWVENRRQAAFLPFFRRKVGRGCVYCLRKDALLGFFLEENQISTDMAFIWMDLPVSQEEEDILSWRKTLISETFEPWL